MRRAMSAFVVIALTLVIALTRERATTRWARAHCGADQNPELCNCGGVRHVGEACGMETQHMGAHSEGEKDFQLIIKAELCEA